MAIRELVALFIASAILVHCESSFVDKLPKCRSWDHDCQRKVIELFIQNIGSTGISDLDNIRIDPYDITGVQISVFDLIDVGITEGNVTGIKECTVSKFVTNYDLRQVSAESVCDILIKTKYRVSSYNPLIKIFTGKEALYGEGSGEIKIDQLKITFDYPFDLVRRNNDLYMNTQLESAKFTFDVLGKVQFRANNDDSNDQSSEVLVSVLNENWKLVMNFVWRNIKNVSTGFIYDFTTKLFNNLPLKFLVTEGFSTNIYG